MTISYRRNRTLLCVQGALAITVGVLAGCGDDSSGTGATTGTASGTTGSTTGTTGSTTGTTGTTGATGATGTMGTTGATGTTGTTGTSGTPDSGPDATLTDAGGDATLPDAGTDSPTGDGAPSACNSAAALLDAGGTLLYAFDNGVIPSTFHPLVDNDPYIPIVVDAGDAGAEDAGDAGDSAAPLDAGDAGDSAGPVDAGFMLAPFAPTIMGITSDGHACPGALALTSPFTLPGQRSEVQTNFNPALATTIATVHLSVKLLFPGDAGAAAYNGVNGLTPFVQWHVGDAAAYSSSTFNTFVGAGSLSDGQWHNVTVPLQSDGGPITLNLDQIGVGIFTHDFTDAGTNPVPTTAVLLIDDIWYE